MVAGPFLFIGKPSVGGSLRPVTAAIRVADAMPPPRRSTYVFGTVSRDLFV